MASSAEQSGCRFTSVTRRAPGCAAPNENTNGLLRDYFPKRTDLFQHSAARLAEVADELNHPPRKPLDWATPAAVFASFQEPTRCDDR